ncbi:hypothetical protein AT6N2_C0899 [Agrobacterium tumefaciens]|nr:hypothetical protein AT6N2_C0899 [Agrobacterium tumefaciens]
MRQAGSARPAQLCHGWSEILRKIGFQPLLGDGVQRPIGLCGGDDAVHLFKKGRLFLVEADKAGRILDQELQFGPLRRVLCENGGGDDVAGGDCFNLPGKESGDRAVVVFVALDGRIGGCNLGQFQILDSAAGDTDGLAGQIFRLGNGDRVRRKDAIIKGRIGGGEVDDLFTVRVLAEARNDEVDLVGLQIGNAVGAGDRHEFDLYAELLADQIGNVDIVALGRHVRADAAEGRKVLRDGDTDRAAGGDVTECIGKGYGPKTDRCRDRGNGKQ